MGIVQQSMHKKANQRVAATRSLAVRCPRDAQPEAIRALFGKWNIAADEAFEETLEGTKSKIMRRALSSSSPNTRHYFLLEQKPGSFTVTFGFDAKLIAENRLRGLGEGWIAQIAPAGDGEEGETNIAVSLLKWRIDGAGHIWNGSRYIQLLDGLVGGLDGRYLSDPVDGKDHYFVSRA
jgi:hypothetical protein